MRDLGTLPRWTWSVVTGIAALVVVLAGYGGVLDNFFNEIDDSLHLWGAGAGVYPSPQFRPLHFAWNQLLLQAFGNQPAGWYAAGLALHVVSALLAAALARKACGSERAGVVAGLTFAAFYSSHQVGLWIASSCGLLVVAGILASALAWVHYLHERRRSAYVLALAGAIFAMGSKEDCVLLAPLLMGLDLALLGRRAITPRAVVRYAPFALLGAVYLAVALRPSHWAESPGGEYSLRMSLLRKLAANFAALFWPRAIDALPPAAAWAGAGLVLVLAAAAWRAGEERRWITLGTVVALSGLLPVLPGPDDMAVAGTRYTYPSAIGVAFLAVGLFELAWRRAPLWATRTLLVVIFAGWIAVQVASVRSVELWRYQRRCDRLASLLDGTRKTLLEPLGTGVVVAPDIWNVLDYACALSVFLHVERSSILIEDVPLDSLRERLKTGGDLDPAANALFTSLGNADIARLSSADEAPWERWEAVAADQAKRARGATVPIVRVLARGPARSG